MFHKEIQLNLQIDGRKLNIIIIISIFIISSNVFLPV